MFDAPKKSAHIPTTDIFDTWFRKGYTIKSLFIKCPQWDRAEGQIEKGY